MPRFLIPTVSFSLPPNDSVLHSLSSNLSALAPRYFKGVILPNLKKKNLLVCSLAGFIFEEHHIWSFNQNAKKKNSPLKASHGPSLSKVDIVIRNEKGNVIQMCQLKCCATKRTCIERLTNEKYAGMQRVGSYEVKRFNILDRVKIGEVESDATTFERMIELGNAIKRFMGKRKKRKNNSENNNLVKCHKINEAFSNLVETRAQAKLRKERESHKNLQLKNNMKKQIYGKKNDDWSKFIRKDQEEQKIQMDDGSYMEKHLQYENGIMDQGMIINSDDDNDYFQKASINVNPNSHLLSKHNEESHSFLKLDEFLKENINYYETNLKIEKNEENMNENKINSKEEIALKFKNELKQTISSNDPKMIQKNFLNDGIEINYEIFDNINKPKMAQKNFFKENESEINSNLSDSIELKTTKTERLNELPKKKGNNLKNYECPPFPIQSKSKNENIKEKHEIKDCFRLIQTDTFSKKEKTILDEKSLQSKVRAMEKLKKYETPNFE